jgi:arylformamidase
MTTLYRSFESQVEIDAQYRVAHSEDELIRSRGRAQALSASLRADMPGFSRVNYGPTPDEYLDVFPAAEPNAPVFVYFHGGYWRALSASDYSFVARGPSRHGFTTVVVNYALAPSVNLDEIVRQARASVAWVAGGIRRYGGNPDRLLVGGHSAGAQLAAMCLLTDWPGFYGLDRSLIGGALLVSGIFDLAPLRHSFLQPQLQLDEGCIARNSPLRQLTRVDASVMLAVGEKESSEFKRQSADFQQAWQSSGNRGANEIVPLANHFQAVEPLLHSDSFMCRWMATALRN